MRTIVFTCEKNQGLLRGFSYQWEKYCGLPYSISGIGELRYELHGNYENLETGNYELEKWSNQVIDTLNTVKDDLILFVLDDYWLSYHADLNMINFGCKLLQKTGAYALDVSSNTSYDDDKVLINSLNGNNIYLNNNKYAYSYQAYVWKKDKLLSCLVPNENPWHSEEWGFARMGNPNLIFSFNKPCLHYANVKYKGEWDLEGKTVVPQRTLLQEDWDELKKLNYIDGE